MIKPKETLICQSENLREIIKNPEILQYCLLKLNEWYSAAIFHNNFNLHETRTILAVAEVFEPHCEKTGFLPRRKQRRRSASR